MSQSCLFLWFLSQNSLWMLSTFRRNKGIYSRVCMECEELVLLQIEWSGESSLRMERVVS